MGIDLRRSSHIVLFAIVFPALSILVSWTIATTVGLLHWKYAFVVDTLGGIGAYATLFKLFDEWAWRWPIFRSTHIVDAPIMAGRWSGTLRSSRNHDSELHPAVVEIRQTFTRAQVCMYFERSHSYSIMSQFIQEDNGSVTLHYEYRNEPNAGATVTMFIHDGTARLWCIEGKARLAGEYYNRGRDDRGYFGNMELEYQQETLLRRFQD